MIGTIAAITAAALMAGGAAGSAAIQAHGAKSAADTQVNGAQEAQAKVDAAVQEANPQIEGGANQAIQWAGDAANWAQTASREGSDYATGRVDSATADANSKLDSYVTLGNGAVAKLSDLIAGSDKPFQFSQDDPSYQWRLEQGQKALERSAAARGAVSGGAAAKQMTRYAQGAASQEYQAAFDRFQTDRATRFNMLSNVAGMGMNAAGKQGDNSIYGAKYGGDLRYDQSKYAGNVGIDAAQFGGRMLYDSKSQQAQNIIGGARTTADILAGAANAKAAGQAGAASAWGGALGNGTSSIAQLLLLSSMGKDAPTWDTAKGTWG